MTAVELKTIKSFDMFSNLKEITYQYIKEHAFIISVKSEQMILEERIYNDNVYFLLDGIVSIYKINSNGQKKIFYMLNEGNFINEDIDEGIASSVNVEAYNNIKLLVISKKDMLYLMSNDFIFMNKVMTSLSRKIRRLYRQLKNTPSSIRIEKKVAAKLYKLCKDYGVKENGFYYINIPLTITYLADLLGSQRETVSRAVKKLQEINLIEYKSKHFIVYNIDELSDYFKSQL